MAQSIGFFISNIGRKFRQTATNRFEEFEITAEQSAVLNQLTEKQGINQKELANLLDKPSANVTRLIDQLEKKHLVERKESPTDRRAYFTYITEQGKEMQQNLKPVNESLHADILSGVTEEELASFRKVLNIINENINKSPWNHF